ncbi:ROK family transcriptional regulator [Paramicrobacterium chengjingii]|uniref:ROK family transcriptional regulator n=1 Tax=Paramicrobacterium chengjingii TaxID=2769067 RepID=A0ABX6YGE1_9MICO|nr:ROK family transcriptional regulator [Microbacterium chengjingii]QPZ37856.1 ROK family transcriptional regulator [Microbacterium chengjingii]
MDPRLLSSSAALRRESAAHPGHTRAHNRALVLQMLYRGSPISRADIARESGLTRVTVSDLVGDLQREGLVVERGIRQASGPGKPAVLLEMARDNQQIVAIDLSGHDVFRAVLTNLDGEISEEVTIPSPDVTGDKAAALVNDLLEWALQLTTAPVLGVGIGVPGIVDTDQIVRRSISLGWTDRALAPALMARFGVPVCVANDANVAVLAEHSFASGGDDLLLVKIGRGVGGGLLLDGRPILGSRLTAGEIGRVLVRATPDSEPVPLESLITAPTLRTHIEKAVVGGETADAALRRAGQVLGVALAPLITSLGLTSVVLTGPNEIVGDALITATRDAVDTHTADDVDHVDIHVTPLGPDIVLRGAAALVLSERLGIV